jgi:hypothetical protein
MAYDPAVLRRTFDRTEGRCHICHKTMCFNNYAKLGGRAAWEVEHSKARGNGGTDHGNNLYAAHIRCNRSKGVLTSRTARARNGFSRSPYSPNERRENAITGATVGSFALGVLFPQFRVASWLIGAAAGAIAGYNAKAD